MVKTFLDKQTDSATLKGSCFQISRQGKRERWESSFRGRTHLLMRMNVWRFEDPQWIDVLTVYWWNLNECRLFPSQWLMWESTLKPRLSKKWKVRISRQVSDQRTLETPDYYRTCEAGAMDKGQFDQISVLLQSFILKVVCHEVTLIQALAHWRWFLSGDTVEKPEKTTAVWVHVSWVIWIIVGLHSDCFFKYVTMLNCPFKWSLNVHSSMSS